MKQSTIIANTIAQRIAFCQVLADKSQENFVIYRIAAEQLYAVADMLQIVIDDLRQQEIEWYRQIVDKE